MQGTICKFRGVKTAIAVRKNPLKLAMLLYERALRKVKSILNLNEINNVVVLLYLL